MGIDEFFISLDLEGDHLLVGESKEGRNDAGAATLYTRAEDGTWSLASTLRPSTPYDHGGFGAVVSLDGNRALIAGYDEQLGHEFNIDRVVYVFDYNVEKGVWKQSHVVDIGEVAFGTAVDLDGAIALIGDASEAKPGAAYVVKLK